MMTAKLFQHGGSQPVRLPKAFRFEGTEVVIEKHGDEVILKPRRRPKLKTLKDVARYMRENFPQGGDFPDIERPQEQQKCGTSWTPRCACHSSADAPFQASFLRTASFR